jgi:hypothetical protein
VSVPLPVIEDIAAASGIAATTEALLPAGVRGRQLTAGTLLTGMMLAVADGRPAHLTRVHAALTGLPEHDHKRLGVVTGWAAGPHKLTYRQAGHTYRLITGRWPKPSPAAPPLRACSGPATCWPKPASPPTSRDASSPLAVGWTDAEAWARAVPHGSAEPGTDPEAPWGHRHAGRAIEEGEMSYG